jgi:hypothetical protein
MIILHDNRQTKIVRVIIDGLSKQFDNCTIVRYNDTYQIENVETTETLATLPTNMTVIFYA